MRLKGIDYTSDYLDFETAYKKGYELIDKNKRLGLLIIFGINTGLRYSDLSRIHDKDIEHALNNNSVMTLTEKKTGKKRQVFLNQLCFDAYSKFPKIGYLFVSQKRSIFSIDYVNRELKKFFRTPIKRNVSTHSLRKTFARTYYENSHDKEDALIKLSDIFNHENTAITRRYLGLTKEEINAIYKHFEILV